MRKMKCQLVARKSGVSDLDRALVRVRHTLERCNLSERCM